MGAPGPACGGAKGTGSQRGWGAWQEQKQSGGQEAGLGSGDSSVQSGEQRTKGEEKRGEEPKRWRRLKAFMGRSPDCLCVGLRRVCCESCTLEYECTSVVPIG